MYAATRLFAATLLGRVAAETGVLYPVDAQALLCATTGAGISQTPIPLPKQDSESPHIFTFFRLSQKAVNITFNVHDANGALITDQTVSLPDLSAAPSQRRLVVEEESESRRLFSSRRRAARSVVSSSRRREPSRTQGGQGQYSPGQYQPGNANHGQYSPGPNNHGQYSPGQYQPGRTQGGYSQGPSQYTPGQFHGPAVPGYQSHPYSNPANPSGASYAYSPQHAQQSYGGHSPMTTSYGYSGAVTPSSGNGQKIAFAAAGGVAAGLAASYLMGHMTSGRGESKAMDCTGPQDFSGTCDACFEKHGKEACNFQISAEKTFGRDEIVASGFVPSKFTGNLSVVVTRIVGEDFDSSKICPPLDANSSTLKDASAADAANKTDGDAKAVDSKMRFSPPPTSALFVSLTKVEAASPVASDVKPEPESSPPRQAEKSAAEKVGGAMSMMLTVLLVLACCGCCCITGIVASSLNGK